MSLNNVFVLFLCLLFIPIQGTAFLGLTERIDQKQKISVARNAYSNGNYEQTIEICQDFLMQNQEAPMRRKRRIYSLLGNAYAAIGDYDHALLTYNSALEVLPNDVELNLALANLYYKTELYDKAIEFYNKTLNIDKNNQQALLGLGRSYLKIGFLSKSRQYFKEYLSLNGEKDKNVYYEYASANFLSRNNNTALDYALKAKEINENNPDIYFLIAKIYNTLNAPQRAEENINTALQLAPDREDIFLTSMLWKAYDKTTAEIALNKIKEYQIKNPESKLALFIEYVALLKLNKEGQAIKTLRNLQKMKGESFIKKVTEQILKND